MKKEKIINSIRKHCNVCLKPSIVCDGVGVFALIDIPKGIELFPDVKPDKTFINWDELGEITTEVKKYLSNICLYNPNGIFLSRTISKINISYYVNHSENYNVFHILDEDKYITTRDIKKGEEILCVYTKDEIDW